MYILMAQNFLVEIILSWVEQVLVADHPKLLCLMAPYLITYCLFLLRETSKSFHACAYESSDGPLLGSAVRQIEKKKGEGRGAIQFCNIYLPLQRKRFIQHCKCDRQNKKLFWKSVKTWVSKMINYFLCANILGCSFELLPNICIIISIITNQGLNYVLEKSG